ncbi:hypothetical protein, partial [Fusobacterium sp.]|uniref:hypothetical protein n=1 Tax=Fusobacterium sp. TaxID=68766 RepID=UPI0025B84CD1
IIMRRIFIFIISVVFFTGCSNIVSRKEFTIEEKRELIVLVEQIRDELKIGETKLLKETLVPSISNNFVKDEIESIDFSKINILSSRPVFLGNKAQNIIGITFQNNTLYYSVDYSLKSEGWKISKIKERRE